MFRLGVVENPLGSTAPTGDALPLDAPELPQPIAMVSGLTSDEQDVRDRLAAGAGMGQCPWGSSIPTPVDVHIDDRCFVIESMRDDVSAPRDGADRDRVGDALEGDLMGIGDAVEALDLP